MTDDEWKYHERMRKRKRDHKEELKTRKRQRTEQKAENIELYRSIQARILNQQETVPDPASSSEITIVRIGDLSPRQFSPFSRTESSRPFFQYRPPTRARFFMKNQLTVGPLPYKIRAQDIRYSSDHRGSGGSLRDT